jgi:hypothetical protein
MDKRYQVFISSTYVDLKEERQAVIQTVIKADCIPAGMELFPAADEEQLAFIKRVIDDCDYYLLIIGGRYGSVDKTGISYTEREYDYAVGKGLKVIALIHGSPDEIPVKKSELDPESRERLRKFKEKVKTGRLVQSWNNSSELPGLVALNLLNAIRTYPAIGWVRADKVANVEVLTEINQLRKRNAELQTSLTKLQPAPSIEGLAGLDEEIVVTGKQKSGHFNYDWNSKTTWRKIFAHISPYLVDLPQDYKVKSILTSTLKSEQGNSSDEVTIDDQIFKTIGLQLKALGLINIEYQSGVVVGFGTVYWSLTPAGERLMMQVRTVPTKKAASGVPPKS